ncbi:FAD binding domain-containing protein [Jatrophihabitans sp. DSM 45814]
MDLPTVTNVMSPSERADLSGWRAGDSYLAGGSWLFSEPQPETARLIDLTAFKWVPTHISDAGLDIAATCTIAELAQLELPARWSASNLIDRCCKALLGSFKVWNVATVGGNLCLALPAGPMISLTAALDGMCTVWSVDGSERLLPVTDFVTGPRRNSLRSGEVLRSIAIPATTLTTRTAFRQYSLSNLGRSAVLVIGRAPATGATGPVVFTVTASTTRPVQLRFDQLPSWTELEERLDATVDLAVHALDGKTDRVAYYDDVHGLPEWRADLTRRLLAEVLVELNQQAIR